MRAKNQWTWATKQVLWFLFLVFLLVTLLISLVS